MLGGRVEERRVIEREKRRKDGKSGSGRWKDRGGEGKKKKTAMWRREGPL